MMFFIYIDDGREPHTYAYKSNGGMPLFETKEQARAHIDDMFNDYMRQRAYVVELVGHRYKFNDERGELVEVE